MSDTPPPPPPHLPPPPPPGSSGPLPAGPPPFAAGPPPFAGGPPPFGFTLTPEAPRRSGKATAGFVLGLCSILLFITMVVPVLAVVFGLLGAKEIKRSNGARTGMAFARIGWIFGLLGVIAGTATWVAVASDLAGTTSVTSLEVGQCVDLPDADPDDEISRLDTFDCDEPHDAEVFSVGDLGDGDDPYPGIDEISDMIAEICIPEFEGYVGTPYGEGELDIFHLYPTESNWEVDQGYVCVAYLLSEDQLSESVEGSGR